jgi:c(7)-type cytochrome triheme protein
VTDSNAQTMSAARARSSRAKRCLALLTALLVTLCLLVTIVVGQRRRIETKVPEPGSTQWGRSGQDYSRFSHTSPSAHAALTGRSNCASCHGRSDASTEPRFPGHKSCTGCHLVQFTAPFSSASDNPICSICHTKGGLTSSNPPLKNFAGLSGFTAEFDHAQHTQGNASARPAEGCAACHAPARRGAAQSIPARLNAHQTCYQCHSPGRQASNLSSCGVCHGFGSHSPTSTSSRAYGMSFSHADHGPRQRLNCASCHNVMGRGTLRARQVTSITPAQHYANPRAQSCMTCHNGQRAFGDTDTHNCKRCHTGQTFKMGE